MRPHASEPDAGSRTGDRCAPAVVATGGGSVLAAENRAVIAAGFSVYLLTDAATVAPRIGADTTRPLLGGDPAGIVAPDLRRSAAHSTSDRRTCASTPAEDRGANRRVDPHRLP